MLVKIAPDLTSKDKEDIAAVITRPQVRVRKGKIMEGEEDGVKGGNRVERSLGGSTYSL